MKASSFFVKYAKRHAKDGGMDMKRIAMLLVLLLCMICSAATASAVQMPEDLKAIYDAGSGGDDAIDYIEFTTPDGVRHAFVLDSWSMTGYQYRDGAWQSVSGGSVLYFGMAHRFQRHGTQALRADGSTYPDDLGFDVLGSRGGVSESYHYNGESFALCGWVDAEKYHGAVLIDGTTIAYYPFGGTEAEYIVDVGDALTLQSWAGDYERHPATPEEAQKRRLLLTDEMADDFPGYTLLSHEDFNWGTMAQPRYYRIEDGLLYLKMVTYRSDYGCTSELDSMPIPLSEAFIRRAETEPIESLLSSGVYGSLFRVDGVIDTNRIPIADRIIEANAQTGGLVLLAENPAGERKLYWVTRNGDGTYRVQETKPLPEGASLDVFHAGNDLIQLEWWDGSEHEVCFERAEDGVWRRSWVTIHGEQGSDSYDILYCGLKDNDDEHRLGRGKVFVGTLQGTDLFDTDFDALPTTQMELQQLLDRNGWAVVNNPDSKDRLHLRTAPKKGADSLGKFYNGTPVQVIEELGDWCHVRIGLDGHLEGYMMTRYLAFGTKMDKVACAYPDKVVREEHQYSALYADAQLRREAGEMSNDVWLVGVVEDELYIILTQTGETGYAPQDWFWEGNG